MRGFDLFAISLVPWSVVTVFLRGGHMIFVLVMVAGIASVGGLSLVLFTERPTHFTQKKSLK
jgi:hypothetical protein